jgi:small subunit ribosomal protein S21
VKVEVRNNNVDGALRILKKKLQREGFYTELREREYHQTKGEKKRLAKAAGRRRCLKELKTRFEDKGY